MSHYMLVILVIYYIMNNLNTLLLLALYFTSCPILNCILQRNFSADRLYRISGYGNHAMNISILFQKLLTITSIWHACSLRQTILRQLLLLLLQLWLL